MVMIKNVMAVTIFILMMLGYSMQAILISMSLLGVLVIIYCKRTNADDK